ncbi:MAG: aminomethyl-transferring glycine dehydrogenase subunit GcvPA [Nitriliruptorales bacterium]|nr:aminomethyl-transferring glycine dehydrogenase subunit GcvPA [Nitriliruptorales bacterium]
MDFAPHTDTDVAEMLEVVGRPSLDALFDHIPASLRLDRALDLPPGRSEDEVLRRVTQLAGHNDTGAICFAGGGAYDHYVPALVGAIVGRGEFLTSYTPYQPEVSQGVLQALFEYQTVISELTGLPISNASLYDGGSAVAEAVSMACAAVARRAEGAPPASVASSGALDLPSRQVVATYAHPLGRPVHVLPVDATSGRTPVADLAEGVAAVVIQQPNALGIVEDVRAHAEAAHASGAKLIVKLEPTAVGLLATPGSQGADLVVGEGQPLGQGLSYGGPTFGFLACAADQVRRLPGRVVGETVDGHGIRGYVMTLRAREQDIRREKATSNICTNQTLCALAALIHLAWLGPEGLRELAHASLSRARHAAARLARVDGAEVAVDGPFLKEFPLRLDVDDPPAAVRALHAAGYLVGPVVPDGPAAGAVMVATTERRTAGEVEGLAEALAAVLSEQRRRRGRPGDGAGLRPDGPSAEHASAVAGLRREGAR